MTQLNMSVREWELPVSIKNIHDRHSLRVYIAAISINFNTNLERKNEMSKTTLTPTNLNFQPRPTYPYAPGTKKGNVVYTSGQVAWNENAEIVGVGDASAQTRQVLSNVVSVLKEGGATPADVLKCNVYLADIRDFQKINEEFAKVFPENPPARTTVEARLAEPEMLVEIEAIAYVD